MVATKRCKQCGSTKSLDNFRQYYNGGNSHYNVCLECESINSRLKYLEKKSNLSVDETAEVDMIYQLYEVQRSRGLKPPRRGKKSIGVLKSAQDMLAKLSDMNADLHEWLTKDLSRYTPEELEEVYDELKAKYRPRIGTDNEYLPVYDNTHKEVLDKILVRFDDYEEEYYAKV